MIYSTFLTLILFFLSSFSINSSTSEENKKNISKIEHVSNIKSKADLFIESVYHDLNTNQFTLPQFDSFSEALKGYYRLKEKGLVKKEILTLIDFSLSSNTKRLWVIDLANNTILFHSLVAHGRNTGEEFASNFSNKTSSFQSSLGFYATGEVYKGKHGISLKLDGLEKGVNCNARNRAVVVHGADYVSDTFIKQHKRLGRSQGCPALPNELTQPIINTIKEQSILFIYHPSRKTTDEIIEKLTS
ncbi:murein L,D-transpeptidase catalytic domain family protein [Flavobacterium polysaccharolyticum]|uniref:Murein L,D-transpeptidase catalytic domain family protein n=1 Tax=Flavobacterium polysaccharolyticum TaxID=3133148 RepID=A0ABU9NN62_9FLAO